VRSNHQWFCNFEEGSPLPMNHDSGVRTMMCVAKEGRSCLFIFIYIAVFTTAGMPADSADRGAIAIAAYQR